MALSATIVVIILVIIAGAVRWFLRRAASANAERVAQQIIASAAKREIDFSDDTPPRNRTEQEIRDELKGRK